MDFVHPNKSFLETDQKVVYLDTAGSALYTLSQIADCHKLLKESSLVNPHSVPEGLLSSQGLERVRDRVLSFFGTSKNNYDVVFTSGATAGLKLVGENFLWREGNGLIYMTDCHTSALGIRDYASSAGSSIYPVDRNWCRSWFVSHNVGFAHHSESETKLEEENYALFLYNGESNFCGTRYQLDFCKLVHKHGMFGFCGQNIVNVVDGAKLAASHPVVLDKNPDIDIFVISFYKIFGYPTGIGCLLIRKDCPRIRKALCAKRYYGGGTILLADAYNHLINYPKRTNDYFHETWEDGTINFVDILVGLEIGINWIENTVGGMQVVERHICEIYDYAREQLVMLSYPNKQPMVLIYEEDSCFSSSCFCGRGNSVITFNVYQPDGGFIHYSSVFSSCLANQIVVRSGMLCNPGSCQYYFGLTGKDLNNIANSSSSCWNLMVGAIRVSFGIHSCREDVSKLLDTIKRLCNAAWENSGFMLNYTMNGGNRKDSSISSCFEQPETKVACIYLLDKMFVYPVKGCRGMSVKQWPISSDGLLYDRKFCLVNAMTHSLLTIRCNSKLAMLKISICLSRERSTFIAQLVFELADSVQMADVPRLCSVYESDLCQPYIHCWLSSVLQVPCQLMTVEEFQSLSTFGKSKRTKEKYRNDAHLLVIHRKSVEKVNECLRSENKEPIQIESFRPNLVIKDAQRSTDSLPDVNERNTANVGNRLMLSLEEDQWSDVAWLYKNTNSQKRLKLQFVGDCVRCMTICIDPETGELRKDREPWLLLSTYRMTGLRKNVKDRDGTFELTKRQGPFFGRLYNVSVTTKDIYWIKLEDYFFQG